jgi:hypothetical protein
MTYNNNIDNCSTLEIQSDHEMMLSMERGLRIALRKNQGAAEKRAILSEMLRICKMYREIRHAQK